ncbi:guanine nucleotide exchange factor for Rab-3A [Rhizophagus clarus]|nr:guanine nucleotide exchange factor for Rab-3A [Rhizophagus clarus]
MNGQENLQQMNETNFIPLILQAQDLVAKLENRVVELENDLEVINESHEQERDQLLQEIGEKDEYVHNLKTKISRLEFGAREAIIVLARTVETFKAQNLDDDDDNSKDDDDNATAVESTDLEGQFLDSIKLCLNYLKNAQNNNKEYKKKHSPIPMRRDSKIQPFNDDYESDRINDKVQNPATDINNDNDNNNDNINDNPQQKPDDDNNISRRESICSEFSVSLLDVDLDGDEDIADYPDPHDLEEIDEDTYQASSINYENIDDEEELEHRRRADFAMSNNKTLINYVHDEPEEIDDRTEHEEETEHEEDEDESDNELNKHHIHDHLPPQGPVPDLSQTANLCPNCNTLLAQVDQHIEERAYLKRDLSALAISLSEEQAIRAQLQVSKENLEQEIDDWINAMFDKVNQMVFDEANTHEELETLNREFKGKLENSIKSSGTRQDRLRELKLLLVHLDTTKQRQAAPTPTSVSGLNRNSVIRRSLLSNSPVNSPRSSRIFGNFGHMSPSIFSTASVDEYMQKGRRVYIDGIVFEEFQEYVKSFVTSPAPTNSTPTHAFMKRCMVEDIQPCLFEGSNGWKSPFYKRRLLDAIMKNQCEIQTIYFSSSNSTPISSQISNTSITRQNSYQEPPPSPKVKCGLCGHLRSCDFRMRLSGPDAAVPPSATTMSSSRTSRFSVTGTPGWIPLDRFCRDRVVAVCDFYTYLSHLRQGLLANSAVWTMYKQCLKHRRKMGMARVGSLSMFEEEEALNNELLNNPEMEGMVVIVH